jgi:CheY-like chemotaxis protein
MNGNEAYDEIKETRPGVKAIFASGYAPDVIRQKVLLDNDVELIYKPISPHALLKKVRTVLDVGEK